MSATTPGTGSTSFEDMSHEQMLAWLDQANSGTVRSAADRLTAAAKKIRKIGEELKVRPQYVDWKGEGADAFRTWAGDLANSTLRLGDFSDDAAKWLGQASDAIAHAQASIPRDPKPAPAHPNAATPAHNALDATPATAKSATELAASAAAGEKIRQEAASQMLKLGQSYRLSATQLEGLERPRFPPPPTQLQPAVVKRDENEVVSVGGAGSRMSSTGATTGALSVAAEVPTTTRAADDTESAAGEARPHTTVNRLSPEVPDQVAVRVDGVQVFSHPPVPPASPVGPLDEGRTVGSGSGLTGVTPPTVPGGVRNPSSNPLGTGTVRPTTGGRAVAQPARGAAGTVRPVTGGRPVGPLGRETAQPTAGQASGSRGSNGITGGRPTSPSPAAGSSTGRRAGGLPRGTVIGGGTAGTAGGPGGATARGPAGPRSSGGTEGVGAGQRATPVGRLGTSDGVMGGRPQPQQRPGARPSGSRASTSRRNGEQDGRNGEQGKKAADRSEEAGPGKPTDRSDTQSEPPTLWRHPASAQSQ
ncbi:translation initiation factor IF-2 [Streptomyces sp. MBT65]|uniref:WXG100 family type VII secretion target n=1 Tax=Streptomyces sp. MBT65 TaxID=1488395 RepID=UPI00190DAFDE|nr:translation initiation factor IF-2 [Streptomyces sp. MBT65]MBK3575305.1 translation initiation factor IF-2 [Streptomyces sp. MBT65]